jgi:mycothione reductase
VWAIGDIANEYQLKHVANHEAATAFWNIAHPDDLREVNHKAVPAAVFSNPQIATVGLTQQHATAAGERFVVGRRDYAGTAYGWALVDETSFAKVLVAVDTGLILGAHIMGPQAATLIQPLVQAMHFDQTAGDIADGPYWIHPALSEVVENALLDAIEQL